MVTTWCQWVIIPCSRNWPVLQAFGGPFRKYVSCHHFLPPKWKICIRWNSDLNRRYGQTCIFFPSRFLPLLPAIPCLGLSRGWLWLLALLLRLWEPVCASVLSSVNRDNNSLYLSSLCCIKWINLYEALRIVAGLWWRLYPILKPVHLLMRVGSDKGRKGKGEFPGAPEDSRAWLACSANARGRCTFWSALVQLGKDLVVSFPGVLTLTMIFSGPLGLMNQWLASHLASGPPVALITSCGGSKISHLVYSSAAFSTHPGALWDYWARLVSPKCGCSLASEHLCLRVWGHCQKPSRQSFLQIPKQILG